MRTLLGSLVVLVALGTGCDCAATSGGTRRPDAGPVDASEHDATGVPDVGRPMLLDAGPRDAARPDGSIMRDDCAPSEVCGNGLDDDCDDAVDDDCSCDPGTVARCFRGPPAARARGVCADGQMVCEGVEFGRWSACTGDVLPGPAEVCDPGGLDENCSGVANEECECSPGVPDVTCGMDMGECATGVQRCVDGMRTACEGAVGPRAETCDGRDEDCDGRIDESLSRSCGVDTGACRQGIETCANGSWGACAGEVQASAESCDALDNDCDGMTDEAIMPRECGAGGGTCARGMQACQGGTYGACTGATVPMPETCNGQDDDCDGMTDEMLVQACGTSVGECEAGTRTCTNGSFGGPCVGEVPAAAMDSCAVRGLDEDCDGLFDEGCPPLECGQPPASPDEMRNCGSDVGLCRYGVQRCVGGFWEMACTGGVRATTEVCNGQDDDCDGMIDQGIVCACIFGVTPPRACGTDTGECVAGQEVCRSNGQWSPCMGQVGPAAEECDMRDDDCDGRVDEGGVCPNIPPTAMCPAGLSLRAGDTTPLAGRGVDPDGGTLRYMWSVASAPAGSSATPSPANMATTSFRPAIDGQYTLRLCVTDDENDTSCCTTSITATATCMPPAAPIIAQACQDQTSWDRRPIVEFAPLPSGVRYELFADGAMTPYATITTTGQNYFRPAAPLGRGGPFPGTAMSITARACLVANPTCCAVSAPINVNLVEDCPTGPVAPTPQNLVFSEYVIDGDGTGSNLEHGEAIEITNVSNCPVRLEGNHFSYCNGTCSEASVRYMDFGPEDIVPPRGVYVAIRGLSQSNDVVGSSCSYDFFGDDDPGLFGLRISRLQMMGDNLESGWFVNGGGAQSQLRIATGPFRTTTSGTTLEIIRNYVTTAGTCRSVGFDAVNSCGDYTAMSPEPRTVLMSNQLGRLWHPCDAVVNPNPPNCR